MSINYMEELMEKIIIGSVEFKNIEENCYEGKLEVWSRETTIFVDIFSHTDDIENIVLEKIKWINESKDKILEVFIEENEHFIDVVNEFIDKKEFDAIEHITEENFINAMSINSLCINIGDEGANLSIDLEAEPDYLFGHFAAIEVDEEYVIESGGLNG